MRTDVQRRKGLHEALLTSSLRPDAVVVTHARLSAQATPEETTVDTFCHDLPQPADHGRRYDCLDDDRSAIRRTVVAADRTPIGETAEFIETSEREGERLRAKAQQRFGLVVPPFPPRLRIAVGNPERFRAFARAYTEGRIEKRVDSEGAAHWYLTDGNLFLTSGADASLQSAAANYVWHGRQTPLAPTPRGAGDFAALDAWRERRNAPDPDTVVLAAIHVAAL